MNRTVAAPVATENNFLGCSSVGRDTDGGEPFPAIVPVGDVEMMPASLPHTTTMLLNLQVFLVSPERGVRVTLRLSVLSWAGPSDRLLELLMGLIRKTRSTTYISTYVPALSLSCSFSLRHSPSSLFFFLFIFKKLLLLDARPPNLS